jgi:small subunit ribosomal protein S17
MNEERVQKNKRVLSGYVISDKGDKTVVVRCQTILQHPLLKKYIRRRKKFMAHDPDNTCQVGDKVQIAECRPMSKRKRWILKSVLEKSV